jgi:GntR family transcriptional repressor for pyruvate dehydrogenase complex
VADRSAGLEPIARDAVPLVAARAIQAFVVAQRLARGDRLPAERDLAAALGIGRPAVREAVRYLAALGVVSVRAGSGIYVEQTQHPALQHLGQLEGRERLAMLARATRARRLIEVELAGLAALTVADRADQLDACIQASEQEPASTIRRHQLDLSFEVQLAELVGDPYLSALQGQAHRLFADAWGHCGLIPRPVADRTAQHRAIAAAIARGDADGARRAMHHHLSPTLIANAADPTDRSGGSHDQDHSP